MALHSTTLKHPLAPASSTGICRPSLNSLSTMYRGMKVLRFRLFDAEHCRSAGGGRDRAELPKLRGETPRFGVDAATDRRAERPRAIVAAGRLESPWRWPQRI